MSIEQALPAGRIEMVQRTLATLRRGTGARCVVLANEEGQVLAQAGTARGMALDMMLSTLAGQAAITAEMDRCLTGRVTMSLHHFEGGPAQVFVAIDPLLILLVLDSSSHPGVVWLFMRRTFQEVRGLLSVEGTIRLAGPLGAIPFNGLTPAQARALGLLPEEAEAEENP